MLHASTLACWQATGRIDPSDCGASRVMIVLLGHNVDAPGHRAVDKTFTIPRPFREGERTSQMRVGGRVPGVTRQLPCPERTGRTIYGERLVGENPDTRLSVASVEPPDRSSRSRSA
jgi:hypothetical protein